MGIYLCFCVISDKVGCGPEGDLADRPGGVVEKVLREVAYPQLILLWRVRGVRISALCWICNLSDFDHT